MVFYVFFFIQIVCVNGVCSLAVSNSFLNKSCFLGYYRLKLWIQGIMCWCSLS